VFFGRLVKEPTGFLNKSNILEKVCSETGWVLEQTHGNRLKGAKEYI
jgi:hypothetical protein